MERYYEQPVVTPLTREEFMAAKNVCLANNRHHIFWERRWYKKQPEREFRCHSGLIVLMDSLVHRDLHVELLPPPKPTKTQMREVVALLDQVPNLDRVGLWGIQAARDYFEQQVELKPFQDIAERSQAIADHLNQQIGFIALGIREETRLAA